MDNLLNCEIQTLIPCLCVVLLFLLCYVSIQGKTRHKAYQLQTDQSYLQAEL